MEINKKDEFNSWSNQRFTIAKRICYVSDDSPVDSKNFDIIGEPFEISDTIEFQLKLNEISPKNEAMRNLAIQEGRDTYTQKFIMKL